MSRQINNTSGSAIFIEDIGVNIQAGIYTIPPEKYLYYASSEDVDTSIDSGDFVIIFNGSNLSVGEGKKLIHLNRTFTADSGDNLTGHIYTTNFVVDDRGKWAEVFDNNQKSNETHFIFPWDVELISISFGNKKNNVRFTLDIYKATAGSGNSDSRIFRWTNNTDTRVATKRTATDTDVSALTDVTFNAGDKLGVYIGTLNDGQSPDKGVLQLYWRIKSSPLIDKIENYSGNF